PTPPRGPPPQPPTGPPYVQETNRGEPLGGRHRSALRESQTTTPTAATAEIATSNQIQRGRPRRGGRRDLPQSRRRGLPEPTLIANPQTRASHRPSCKRNHECTSSASMK